MNIEAGDAYIRVQASINSHSDTNDTALEGFVHIWDREGAAWSLNSFERFVHTSLTVSNDVDEGMRKRRRRTMRSASKLRARTVPSVVINA
jgi:hypothetical protein